MVTTSLKELLRPLIPDQVMARYRLAQHSKSSRWNVDVFVSDRRAARKWLMTTPDTYRVRLTLPSGMPGTHYVVQGTDRSGRQKDAIQVLADPSLSAAVVAEVATPRLVGRRRAEPQLAPTLIAIRQEALDEIGGAPGGSDPLPGLLTRLRDAGHPIGLIPVPASGATAARRDPVEPPALVILAAVPMHDIGGGSRSTQLALEFLRQGFSVGFVSLYEAQESIDLGLRYVHPRLEQYRVERFDPDAFADRVAEPGLAIVEAPDQRLVNHAAVLQRLGWELVYDMIDNWSDPALGGDWFDEGAETRLVSAADRVVASASDLVDRARLMGRDAVLVPNGVNAEIFGVDLPPRPADLPEAGTILGYHGSLYGDWFDWDALRRVAEAYPEAAVVLIGDDKVRPVELPANVHFLGLKAQQDLPAYVQRFDVGLLPFKVNATTHAVSPLKVYEYLASGVPVAAPPLRSLAGLDGVARGQLSDAAGEALSFPRPSRGRAILEHSWANRVQSISAGLAEGRRATSSTVVAVRPPDHFAAQVRLVS